MSRKGYDDSCSTTLFGCWKSAGLLSLSLEARLRRLMEDAVHSLSRGTLTLETGTDHGIEWEECECLSCGSDKWTAYIEAPDLTPGGMGLWFVIVKCRECGLCFTNPRPSPVSMPLFYASDYTPHDAAPEHSWKKSWWRQFRVRGSGAGQRKALRWHGQGRLLDFGCGSGSFLLRMREQGWKVTGLDCSPAPVAFLRDHWGVHALTGSLPHPDLAASSFDVITMWQALEHLHQPLKVLQSARKLLAPG